MTKTDSLLFFGIGSLRIYIAQFYLDHSMEVEYVGGQHGMTGIRLDDEEKGYFEERTLSYFAANSRLIRVSGILSFSLPKVVFVPSPFFQDKEESSRNKLLRY